MLNSPPSNAQPSTSCKASNASPSNEHTLPRTQTAALEVALVPLVGPGVAKLARVGLRVVLAVAALYSVVLFTREA